MKPIYAEAQKFMEAMYDYDKYTFQTVPRKDLRDSGIIDPTFRHGTLDEKWEWLCEQNSFGANIYVMVNQGDYRRRSLENVVSLRAVLVDLDGAPLEPLLALDKRPHIITETSPGRYQGIWKVQPISVDRENRYQIDDMYKRLHHEVAKKFNGDLAGKGLSHVCRLPGFINHNHKPLSVVRVHGINEWDNPCCFDLADFLDIDLSQPYTAPHSAIGPCEIPEDVLMSDEPIYRGVRNLTLFYICNRLSYKRVRGEQLSQAAMAINAKRCKPPLLEKEVRAIAQKVTKHFARYSNDEVVIQAIKLQNFGMSMYKGNFYRYDSTAREYRVVGLVPLRNKIWELTNKTADDARIKNVLRKLTNNIPCRDHVDNMERQFIRNNLITGGRSVLRVIHDRYKVWISDRGTQPVDKSCLRQEIESMFPGTYKKSVRFGERWFRGFLGLSLVESDKADAPIFEYEDYDLSSCGDI